MTQHERQGRWCMIAGIAAFVLATAPALLVYFYLERVPTIAFPIAVSMIPFFARTRRQLYRIRVTALFLLALFVFAGLASVGSLFAPSVVAMALACNCARPLHSVGASSEGSV